MKYKNPNFNTIFSSSISSYIEELERQKQRINKSALSASTSALTLQQISRQESVIEAAQKAATSLSSIANPISDAIAAQQKWQEKFRNEALNPWSKMQKFTKFHNQTLSISKLVSPSLSEFINNNVRTNYDGIDEVSGVEATYLETFEQLESEIDTETFDEAVSKIETNPEWKEDLIQLAKSFHKSYLTNDFFEELSQIINKRVNSKNKNIVPAIITILIMIYTILSWLEGESEK